MVQVLVVVVDKSVMGMEIVKNLMDKHVQVLVNASLAIVIVMLTEMVTLPLQEQKPVKPQLLQQVLIVMIIAIHATQDLLRIQPAPMA